MAPRRPPVDGDVFICWSRPRSQRLADTLCGLLTTVVPELKGRVHISTQLDKGVRWFDEIMNQLERARVGVLCLNAENLTSPWLHFEAGALARGLNASPPGNASGVLAKGSRDTGHLFTYLHGVSADRLAGPLAAYQSSSATREDTSRLITSLTNAIGLPATDNRRQDAFDDAWPAFERELEAIRIDVQEIVPDFETWFRRKTFEEPVRECVDQSWMDRYNGARQTLDRVRRELPAVQGACHRYQVDLYERLVSVLDGYEMAIRAFLVRAEPFELDESGRLIISPGVVRACDGRREEINGLVARILDPLGDPSIDEAAAFSLSDSFEQRKMIVHRIEHALLSRPGVVSDSSGKRGRTRGKQRAGIAPDAGGRSSPSAELPLASDAAMLMGSRWDLDRIVGYLLIEHFDGSVSSRARNRRTKLPTERELTQSAVMEMERVRSRSAGVTLMPLHYALGALKALLSRGRGVGRQDRSAIDRLLTAVERLIEESRPAPGKKPQLDRGGHVARTLAEIRSVLARGRKWGAPATKPPRRRRPG
jgi:hypothetical protein